MRQMIILIILPLILLTGCNRSKSEEGKVEHDKKQVGESYYLIVDSAWGYGNESEIGKKVKDVFNKVKLEFGDPLLLSSEKEINGERYGRVTFKDSEYWLRRDSLAKELVVVVEQDVATYLQADEGYPSELVLKPGEIGIFIKEVAGFKEYNILNFRKGSSKAVGHVWVKGDEKGFSRESLLVKEAYYLSLARYYLDIEKSEDRSMVNFLLDKGLMVSKNSGKNSFITEMLKEFKGE